MLNSQEQQTVKTFSSLKDKVKSLPCEEVAKKLELNLTRTGNSLQGDCPAGHLSKSGKCFSINEVDNYGHCFSCGRGFDNISLVQVKLNKSFAEAIEWLANNFNIKHSITMNRMLPRPMTKEEEEELQRFHVNAMLYESAFKWMHYLLLQEENNDALKYLVEERKYEKEILEKSEFCYFPKVSQIKGYLQKVHPDASNEIEALPLNGHYKDNFRLAIPYRNAQGQITGFLKRATTPRGITIEVDCEVQDNVRWDSTYSLKKKDIFNLSNCSKDETLIIVEGYPDAVYFTAAGIKNIVAVGQGLLSKNHIEGMVKRGVKNVTISFDNDEVGPSNTERAVELLLKEGSITSFVLDPKMLASHKDPDEYFRANGITAFISLLNKQEKGLYWYAERKINLVDKGNSIEKEKVKNEIIELTKYAKDQTDITYLIDLICRKLDYLKTDIKAIVKEKQKEKRTEDLKKVTKNNDEERYYAFIEKSTSSYAYWDKYEDSVYLGVPHGILENILLSAGQLIPEVFDTLKVDFDVHYNERIVKEKELFNLFVPSEYMLLNKTDVQLEPEKDFPSIYKLLSNLLVNENERNLFINWLAGILQTREKQLTAWVFKGKPGAGKGLLLTKVLKPLFGKKQAIQVEDEQLQAPWNPWLQNTILLAFNEVAHDNETRNNIKSKLKAIITDSEIMINEKNLKQYFIMNCVNCLFFSNEGVPVVIEEGDRRFNVVTTGNNLRSYDWFNTDPDKFIASLEAEVKYFAQYLMNWNYDSVAAKTAISNDEKNLLIASSMTCFEEFAMHLKNDDAEWFEENIPEKDIYGLSVRVTAQDLGGKITKKLALEAFKAMYPSQKISGVSSFTKKLKLYGIDTGKESDLKRTRTYTWASNLTNGQVAGQVIN
ncbi:MAG: DUF5906 domain-containing protein [Syntrophothermus sp.]